MKNIFCFILIIIFSTGCNSKSIENEDFSGEYFKNFSAVENIVNYLQLDKDNVTILSEDDKQLIFCFSIDNSIDLHDETILSYANYARRLKREGYKLTVLDATISGTLLLEDNDNIISITTVSDSFLEEFKRARKDINNVNKIDNENLIFEITRK